MGDGDLSPKSDPFRLRIALRNKMIWLERLASVMRAYKHTAWKRKSATLAVILHVCSSCTSCLHHSCGLVHARLVFFSFMECVSLTALNWAQPSLPSGRLGTILPLYVFLIRHYSLDKPFFSSLLPLYSASR